MASAAREKWEKIKAAQKEKKPEDQISSGNSARDAWEKVKASSDTAEKRFQADVEKVDDSYINQFLSNASDFLTSAKSEYEKVGWGNASDTYESRYQAYRDLDYRQRVVSAWLDANKEALPEDSYKKVLDFIKAYNSDAATVVGAFQNSKNFYSQWATEDAYNFWEDHSTYENRQAWYTEQKGRIEALNAELAAAGERLGAVDVNSEEFPAAQQEYIGTRMRIEKEIKAVEAEINNYKRGNYTEDGQYYGRKVVDDYYQYSQRPDFNTTSANRDFDNATKEDFDKWYYQTYGGVMIDPETGKEIEGSRIDPGVADIDKDSLSINDPLGFYLQAMEYRDSDSPRYESFGAASREYDQIMVDASVGDWDQLDDTEIGIYYVLLNEQGNDAAKKFLTDMAPELNRRATISASEANAEMYDEASLLGKIALNAATVPASVLSAPWAFLEDVVATAKGEDINPYSAAHSGMHFSNTIRGETAKDINSRNGGKIWGLTDLTGFTMGDAYQSGMSLLDSYLAMGIGGKFGGALLATNAANSEAARLYEQGASVEQIAWGSAAAGAAEMVFESLSIERFIEMKDAKTVGQAVKNVLIQGGIEASEEAATEIANIITNAIVMGDQSDWAKLVEKYDGDTRKAFQEKVRDVANASMSGLISGVGSSGIKSAATGVSHHAQQQKQYANTGNIILNANGGVDALKALAMETAGANRRLTRQAGKVTGETYTGTGLGKAAATVRNNRNRKNVGKLYSAVSASVTEQNRADIVKSLTESGLSPKSARNIADALIARSNGRELTQAQRNVLETVKNSDRIRTTVDKVLSDLDSPVNRRTQNKQLFDMGIALGVGIAPENASQVQSTAAAQQEAVRENRTVAANDQQITGKLTGKKALQVAEETSEKGETADAEAVEDKASSEGETQLKKTGKTVNIKGIAAIHNGDMTLELDSGEMVKAEDVAFRSEGEAQLYEAVASLNVDAEIGNLLIGAYRYKDGEGVSAGDYALGMVEAFQQGIYNIPRDEMEENPFTAKMTVLQRNSAYELGQRFGGKQVAVGEAKIRKARMAARFDQATGETVTAGKVLFMNGKETTDLGAHLESSGKEISAVQETAIRTMERLSAVLGVDFYVYESYMKDGKRVYTDENGAEKSAPSGKYTSDGKIFVDLNAGDTGKGTMLYTVAHELTHYIRQWSPAKFKVLADFLVKLYGNEGVSVDALIRQQMEKARKQGITLSYDQGYEEMVADSMEAVLTDGNVVQMMAQLKQEDRTLWEKIRDWFKNLAAELKAVVEAYRDHRPDSAEGRMVADMQDMIGVLESLYTEALVEASDNYQAIGAEKNTTEKGGVRYMSRDQKGNVVVDEDVDPQKVRKTLTDIYNGNYKSDNNYFPVLKNTPEVYKRYCYLDADRSFVMAKKKAYKAMQQKNKRQHALGVDGLMYVIENLGTPDYIVYQNVGEYAGNYAAIIISKEREIFAAVQLGEYKDAQYAPNGEKGYYNTLITAFYPNEGYIDNNILIPENDVVYDKNEDPLQVASGVTPSDRAEGSSKNSIRNPGADVKEKFSLRKLDTTEIQRIQAIGKKSIHSFSAADVQATQKLAAQYWQEMGVRSPFFRAWFGDWREFDKTPVQIADRQGNTRGIQHNEDTGWDIQVSGAVFNETNRHTRSYNVAARPYLQYINDIVSKAVLLDSYALDTVKTKSVNSLLMHSFYAVADFGNGQEILKLYVEEMNDPNNSSTTKRAYQLQNIEKYQQQNGSSQNSASSISSATGSIVTVADLFAAVKQKDQNFVPGASSAVTNADGTPKVMYHGSRAQFTVFDKKKAKSSGLYGRGFYFTDSDTHAGTYGNLYRVYLKIHSPLQHGAATVNRNQVRKFLEAVADNEDYSIENYGTYDVDRILQTVMGKYRNADAFQVIQDVSATAIGDMVEAAELFNSVNGTSFDGIIVPTETVVFDPGQIKSATDNRGTFDPSDRDILHSLRDPESDKVLQALEEENAKLREDVSYLKEMLKLQRQVTGGTKFTKTSVEAAARYLKQAAVAKGNTGELAKLLNDFYEQIAADRELTWETVRELARPAAQWLLKHRHMEQGRTEYANDILKELRTSRISLDDSQKAEAAHRWGSFNDFRKAAMGTVAVTGDGVPLDIKWQEWASLYPGVFDSEISASDMPGALMDAVNTLRNSDLSKAEAAYHEEMLEQDMIRQVYDSFWRVSSLRTVADVKQKQINDLKAKHYTQMDRLRTFHREKTQQLKQEHRDRLDKLRKDHRENLEKKQKEAAERYRESRQKAAEGRNKTALRHKIQSVVGELNQLLLANDKKRHVPDSLKKAVADALVLVNMDTVGAEERAAKYAALIAKETDPDKIDAYTATMENILRQGEKMGQRLKDLRDAYEEIQESDDPDIANAYDPVIAGSLKELASSIGNTSLRNMTIEQLSDVYDMYRMVLTRVRDANKSFLNDKKEAISNLASRVVGEVRRVGGEHKHRAAVLDFVRKFGWNNLKPAYAFERIGSATLTDAFNNVRTGEDVWAIDVTEAREYYLDKSKKYGYDSWDFKKKYRFESASGLDFELTLDQILSLYAYSKREQAHDHLKLGGFVFDSNIETYKEKGSKFIKYRVNTADAHQITPDILANIISKLSSEQMGFVDEMQDYLSTVMGAKGNEVTMKMYGVKLFKEKFYFPLKSAKQFMFEQNEVSGEVKIKNSGFTNKVVAKANNPVILSNFMDVWTGHVNDMSMYHAFVLPLEDFNRIFNYNSPKKEGQPPVSVKGTIQSAYTPAAVSYVRQLITDLNGGAIADPRETFSKAMMSKFKKAKVMASLSVVIQQPSSIGRAFALVDPKHFQPTKDGMNHAELWEELKHYAPVAIIKEMGYFDTNMGKSTQDFIMAKKYSGIKEKAKALFTDEGYRDELLSKAPALADELTWCAIWNAVKRETKAKNPGMDVKSEAFLKKAGERFTEVVSKTQVYDSVLARSANMRSKSGMMSMVTSFMAEPTTTINMLEDAVRKAKRGYKGYAARAFAAVAVSVVLNNAFVSLVYAGRDDDEDETFFEKYMQSFVSGMLDDINPLTYYPYLKDVWSLLQGYDIERADMSLISDIANAAKKLIKEYFSEDGDVAGAWWDFTGTVANIGGIPVQNIRREVNGAINFVKTIVQDVNGRATTWGSMGNTLEATMKDSLPVIGWLPSESKTDKLYDAIISGDTAYVNRLKSGYKDQSAINSAIRKALRENDPRIREAAEARFSGEFSKYKEIFLEIKNEGNFSFDTIMGAVNAEVNALESKAKSDAAKEPKETTETETYFDIGDYYSAVLSNDQAAANLIFNDLVAEKIAEGYLPSEAEDSVATGFTTQVKQAYVDGEISRSRAVDLLTANTSNGETKVKEWDFELRHGYSWSARARMYRLGKISRNELISAVMDIEGKSRDVAEEYTRFLDLEMDNQDLNLTASDASAYFEHAEPAGIAIDVYLDYRERASRCESDKDKNGKSISGSKKSKMMDVINSLPITSAQKDALYYAEGWAESTIDEAPWH